VQDTGHMGSGVGQVPPHGRGHEPGEGAMTPVKTLPGGKKVCQCAKCRNVFTTVGNFDRHRRGMKCHEPSTVGLELNYRGVWKMPGKVEQ